MRMSESPSWQVHITTCEKRSAKSLHRTADMLEPMGILEIIAAASAIFTGVLIIIQYKHRDRAMAVLIGISAGMVGLQALRVHVFTILVVLWMLLPSVGINRGAGKRITWLATCSVILALTALIGDLAVSPTLALQLLALTASASIIVAKATARDRKDMLYGLLALVSASSFLGVLQVAKIVPIEIWHAHVSSVGRPIGIYSEPDWLGLFAGLGLIMAWRMQMPPALRTLLISVNAAALMFAFARAAWIGVGASVALFIVLSLLNRNAASGVKVKRGKWPAVALVLAAGATFLSVNPSFASDFTRRLEGTFSVSSTDISGQARVRQIDGLVEMARTAPWYGHGLSANGRVGIWGTYNSGDASDSTNAVSSNWLLAMWVDGQLLAVPLVALLIGVALFTGRTIAGQLLVVVLLNSLFSNATFQPITWLLIALALSTAWDREAGPSLDPPGKELSHSTHERTHLGLRSRHCHPATLA